MNATDVKEVKLSPDGSAAVIATVVSDWQHNRFRSDLWIWKAEDGRDGPADPIRTRALSAMVSRWQVHRIPFRSSSADGEDKDSDDVPERLWLIAADSGESFPLYKEKLEAHAFAWSADGSQIFFSCTSPLSKSAEEAKKAQWKDVIRWREQERGDLLLALPTRRDRRRTEEPAGSCRRLPTTLCRFRRWPGRSAASDDEIKEIAPEPKGRADRMGYRFCLPSPGRSKTQRDLSGKQLGR